MLMDKLIVVGGGGFAKEVAWLAVESGFDYVGYLDDDSSVKSQCFGQPCLGNVNMWESYLNHKFVLGIGNPRNRKAVFERMMTNKNKPEWATLIHPSVSMSNVISIGDGSIIAAGCTLTVDIEIGNHCILNINSTVGHDCFFGDFVTVAPLAAVSGNVKCEELVEVGTGSSIRQGIKLGYGSMLGMGSVLTKNLPESQVYVGNPAKLFNHLD